MPDLLDKTTIAVKFDQENTGVKSTKREETFGCIIAIDGEAPDLQAALEVNYLSMPKSFTLHVAMIELCFMYVNECLLNYSFFVILSVLGIASVLFYGWKAPSSVRPR